MGLARLHLSDLRGEEFLDLHMRQWQQQCRGPQDRATINNQDKQQGGGFVKEDKLETLSLVNAEKKEKESFMAVPTFSGRRVSKPIEALIPPTPEATLAVTKSSGWFGSLVFRARV